MEYPWFFSYKDITMSFRKKNFLFHWMMDLYPKEQLALYGGEVEQQIPLLFLLGGYVNPPRGTIYFNWGSSRRSIQPKLIGMGPVPPFTPFFSELRVRESLILHSTLFQVKNASYRADQLIQKWELTSVKEERIRDLTEVDQRCTEIAMALVHRPKLLLLHLPEQNLEDAAWQDIWQHLLQIQQEEGFAIAYSTFDSATANKCSKIVNVGRINNDYLDRS